MKMKMFKSCVTLIFIYYERKNIRVILSRQNDAGIIINRIVRNKVHNWNMDLKIKRAQVC